SGQIWRESAGVPETSVRPRHELVLAENMSQRSRFRHAIDDVVSISPDLRQQAAELARVLKCFEILPPVRAADKNRADSVGPQPKHSFRAVAFGGKKILAQIQNPWIHRSLAEAAAELWIVRECVQPVFHRARGENATPRQVLPNPAGGLILHCAVDVDRL